MAKKRPALPARVSTGIGAAGTALTIAGHPHLAVGAKAMKSALDSLVNAAGGLRERRIHAMWAQALDDNDDPIEFTRDVEMALLRDGDQLADGFVAGAQAAADAISFAVIPSIGLLVRSYLTKHVPTRREYRAILGVLRVLDDAEFGVLRGAVTELAKLVTEFKGLTTLNTVVERDPNKNGVWHWYSVNVDPRRTLAEGPLAPVIVQTLAPLLIAAEFEQPLVINPATPGFGHVGSNLKVSDPQKPELRSAMVAILAEIMPTPRAGS